MRSQQQKRVQAVALGYDQTMDEAPKVTGKGKGYVAEELIRIAKENNVPIQEDPSLVELLSQLEMNQTVPAELYKVVAELFAFIYQVDRDLNKSTKKDGAY